MEDTIEIHGLQTATRIGVPEQERSRWQTLEIDLTLVPKVSLTQLNDDLKRTIDYEAVCLRVRDLAAERPRQLIETLAEEIAVDLLERFALASVSIKVRKFIIPGAEWVAVQLQRFAGA